MHLTVFCNNRGSHLSPHAGDPLSIRGHLESKRRCLHGMATGLDCRMTSLFLKHQQRRGEQSNAQWTHTAVRVGGGTQQFQRYTCSVLPSKAWKSKVSGKLKWNYSVLCAFYVKWYTVGCVRRHCLSIVCARVCVALDIWNARGRQITGIFWYHNVRQYVTGTFEMTLYADAERWCRFQGENNCVNFEVSHLFRSKLHVWHVWTTK